MNWELLGILYAVCAVLCAVGFWKFVYFLSVGYGLAVAGGGVAVFIMYLILPTATPLWLVLIQTLLFVAYGARLSGFLLLREFKNASFRKTDVARESLAKNDEKKMPVFVAVFIWIVVAALYVMQVSPVLFRWQNASADLVVPLVGIAVSVCGLLLESLADKQKSAQKKVNPGMVATEGLYRIVRCPNYLGEITFWTGVFVAGLTTYRGVGQWIFAVVAYIAIVYIMFNGAQRMEKRQMKQYGHLQAYNEYADKTPIILPLLPIYHLNKKEEKK